MSADTVWLTYSDRIWNVHDAVVKITVDAIDNVYFIDGDVRTWRLTGWINNERAYSVLNETRYTPCTPENEQNDLGSIRSSETLTVYHY